MKFAKLYQLGPEQQVLLNLDYDEEAEHKFIVVQTAYYKGTLVSIKYRFYKEAKALALFDAHTEQDACKFLKMIEGPGNKTNHADQLQLVSS